VLIYGIVGLGLMLLAGFTGLFSIGHAAFLGVGAYTEAVLGNAGVPFPLALAAGGGAVGRGRAWWWACRRCASRASTWHRDAGLRLHRRGGVRALGSVTGGNAGKHVKPPSIGRWQLDSGNEFYYLCLVLAVLDAAAS
jgi:branched-chain amino acid transport system permease protein